MTILRMAVKEYTEKISNTMPLLKNLVIIALAVALVLAGFKLIQQNRLLSEVQSPPETEEDEQVTDNTRENEWRSQMTLAAFSDPSALEKLLAGSSEAELNGWEDGLREGYAVGKGEMNFEDTLHPNGNASWIGYWEAGYYTGYLRACIEDKRSCPDIREAAATSDEEPATIQAETPTPTFDQDYFEVVDAQFANEYNGRIIQIGGAGSQLVQKFAVEADNNQNLIPADEWVTTMFTRGEAIWVNCREGYTVSACGVNLQLTNDTYIDPQLGCFYELGKDQRTDIEIRCVQSN